MYREAERGGTVPPGEEEAWGNLSSVMGGSKEDGHSSQWCGKDRSHWSQLEIQDIQFKHTKNLLYCEGVWTLKQDAWSCGVSILQDTQNQTEHSLEQRASGGSALSKNWYRLSSEEHPASVVLILVCNDVENMTGPDSYESKTFAAFTLLNAVRHSVMCNACSIMLSKLGYSEQLPDSWFTSLLPWQGIGQ